MKRFLLAAAAWVALGAPRPPDISFKKIELDLGANETAAVADINRDGRLDIVSGENWYEAPTWAKRKFRELHFESNYIDAFSDLPMDVDGDGWVDVVTASWFSKEISWWKNPGRTRMVWVKRPVITGFNTEFAFLVDIDNDGQAREVLPQFGGNGPTVWLEYQGGEWRRHTISEKNFGHGIGAGDLNGDKRTDVLTPRGWFEAPADPRSGQWTYHPDWEFKEHLGFQFVHDVTGDGKPEVIFGNAHDYGLFYLEQTAPGKWEKRTIDGFWSQVHAVTLADMNGDGKLDIVAGKRFLAHDYDPGARDPLGIFWYESIPAGNGRIQWVRHIIDYGSRAGAGMQLAVADLEGDGDLDIVAPGKSGLYLFENLTKRKETTPSAAPKNRN
jgi:hypothetical protein